MKDASRNPEHEPQISEFDRSAEVWRSGSSILRDIDLGFKAVMDDLRESGLVGLDDYLFTSEELEFMHRTLPTDEPFMEVGGVRRRPINIARMNFTASVTWLDGAYDYINRPLLDAYAAYRQAVSEMTDLCLSGTWDPDTMFAREDILRAAFSVLAEAMCINNEESHRALTTLINDIYRTKRPIPTYLYEGDMTGYGVFDQPVSPDESGFIDDSQPTGENADNISRRFVVDGIRPIRCGILAHDIPVQVYSEKSGYIQKEPIHIDDVLYEQILDRAATTREILANHEAPRDHTGSNFISAETVFTLSRGGYRNRIKQLLKTPQTGIVRSFTVEIALDPSQPDRLHEVILHCAEMDGIRSLRQLAKSLGYRPERYGMYKAADSFDKRASICLI